MLSGPTRFQLFSVACLSVPVCSLRRALRSHLKKVVSQRYKAQPELQQGNPHQARTAVPFTRESCAPCTAPYVRVVKPYRTNFSLPRPSRCLRTGTILPSQLLSLSHLRCGICVMASERDAATVSLTLPCFHSPALVVFLLNASVHRCQLVFW